MALNLVRIASTDERSHTFRYNGDEWELRPGGEIIVPYEAMCLWFGNPAARDFDARNRARTDEFKRLRVKYGAYDNEELFEAIRPKATVSTIEGDRISTVAEDPHGEAYEVRFGGEQVRDDHIAAELSALRNSQQALLDAITNVLTPAQQAELAEQIKPGSSASVVVNADADDMPAVPTAAPAKVVKASDPVREENDGDLPADEPVKPRTNPRSRRS